MFNFNKLKVLFIGLGSIGVRHLKNLCAISNEYKFDLEIDALRSSHRPLDDEILKLINNEYYSVDEIGNYDCIFIANPTNLHYKTILHVQEKAKAFFVEKPLDSKFLSDEQLNKIDFSKIFYVACPLRHTIVFKKLQEVLKNKKVYSARALCSSYLPDWRKGVDYRKVYSAKAENGGIKVDLIHDFDYIFELFGFPKENYIFEGKYSNLEINSTDCVNYIGKYEDKIVNLYLDYFGKIPKREIEIYMQDDVIIADFINSKIRINNKWIEYKEERNSYCINEIKYFLLLYNNKKENINDIQKANIVLKTISGEK